jgi:DNA-binding response OmpR family regulator
MTAYRVLVVEDNHEVRRMVTASLKTLGQEIDVLDVPSAEEALFISASLPLDLVVLDFRLPGMTGIDMVGRLRKKRPETRVILVTGVEDAAVRRQVAEAHAEAYFYKPIEIDRFLAAVKCCLWGDRVEPAQANTLTEAASTSPAAAPVASHTTNISEVKPAPAVGSVLPLDERLATLKQQLRATSVVLVNSAGQVLEVAGNPSLITSGSALFSSLMHAFRASSQISQIVGTSAGFQYFASQRQCLYMTLVGSEHALFAVISGYYDPERLTAVDRYLQMAARDLQDLLADLASQAQARQEKLLAELPTQVEVDPQTRQRVDEMFTQVTPKHDQQGAERFWEAASNSDGLNDARPKNTLSYEQARDLGLATEEDLPT